MLTCLQIRDFAIIDELVVELGPGLNVLTGETGAGKSILISALELVLGGRGKPEHVRSGAKRAEVEALFELGGDAAIRDRLASFDVSDDELVVRRVVMPNGRSRAFVNGRLATREQLAILTRGLTDISSQHLHHTLTDPTTHLGYLDAFGELGDAVARVQAAYHALEQARALLRRFEARLASRHEREAVTAQAIEAIEAVAPQPGEDERLAAESNSLRHSEHLLRLLGESLELLYERDDSALDLLAQAGQRLNEATDLDPAAAELAEQLDGARTALQDTARDLSRRLSTIRPDPAALERLEERLFELDKLKRRYGGTLDQVLAHLEACRAELGELDNHLDTRDGLRKAHAQALDVATRTARALSAKRHRAAPRLAQAITRELASLGMGEARVQVDLSELSRRSSAIQAVDTGVGTENGVPDAVSSLPSPPSPPSPSSPSAPSPSSLEAERRELSLGPDGMDRAEFLIAPNRGEEALPLRKVASGGELSRALLAIKCVLADLGPAGMYAFDEIDSGVGGGMAEIIGRKIQSVSRHRQVLCVTHLPQIAVFADRHFKVEKSLRGDRTLSTIRKLTAAEQAEEIARMLGGLKITSKTRAAARELLEQARASSGPTRSRRTENAA